MEARTINYGDIGWAINHVRVGHRMRRKAWPAGAYISLPSLEPPTIMVTTADSNQSPMIYQSDNADILATDWEMLEPTQPGEYHLDEAASA